MKYDKIFLALWIFFVCSISVIGVGYTISNRPPSKWTKSNGLFMMNFKEGILIKRNAYVNFVPNTNVDEFIDIIKNEK